jgi:hypothetical protein
MEPKFTSANVGSMETKAFILWESALNNLAAYSLGYCGFYVVEHREYKRLERKERTLYRKLLLSLNISLDSSLSYEELKSIATRTK